MTPAVATEVPSVEASPKMRSLLKALNEKGWTDRDLARETQLDLQTIKRAFKLGGTTKHINVRSAKLIAEAFGGVWEDFFRPEDVTHKGRPPLTGGAYTVRDIPAPESTGSTGSESSPELLAEVLERWVPTKKRVMNDTFCTVPEHSLLLPLSGVCDLCVA